jgi:tetratricopeptide (TPR) repeat protein
VTVLSGHPLLVQAAINAAKQWAYKPFVVDGQAVNISTVIEVPFSLGISEADSRLEQQNNDAYFRSEGECRKLLREHKFSDANDVCTSLPQLAGKLPPERKNERRLANQFAGSVLFNEKKFPGALQYYEREVAIAEESLKPYEAELGYAYHDVARGYHVTGDPAKAQRYYEKSEQTLRQAREHIEGDFLKNEYSKAIQSVLRDYIVLLGQTGQDKLTMDAQERLKAITTEVH